MNSNNGPRRTSAETVDVEQEENLLEISKLLASAGYFRARIHGLGPFDKIVGGMVWCISLCARNIDVDLLYSENSTIGQKISLTEKIVEVLPELKCPYSLEPHQIQGLDSFHILPVIQWLVKEANIVREKLGDETLNFAVYEFGQEGWYLDDELEKIGNSGVLPLVSKNRKVYRRVMRMKQPRISSSVETATESQSNQFQIPKSSHKEAEEVEEQQHEEDLIVVQGTDHRGDLIFTTEKGESTNELDADDEFRKLESEENKLNKEMEAANQRAEQLKEKLQELDQITSNFEKSTRTVPQDLLEQMRSLLAERDELKAAESLFKAQCREELAQLDHKIGTSTGDDQLECNRAVELLEKTEQRLYALSTELAALNGEIVRLSRNLGARPSQAEMAQYQLRYVELCNQMVSKHRETKRQYILYNNLVDVRNFTRKQIDLLDSIDRQRDLALREEYGDSLLDSLQKIARAIDESLDKKLCEKRSLQEQRDQLQEELQMLLDKHRLYTKTVVEFQQECQRKLQAIGEMSP